MVNLLIQYYRINNLCFLFLILFFGVIFDFKMTNFKKIKEVGNNVKYYSKKNN